MKQYHTMLLLNCYTLLFQESIFTDLDITFQAHINTHTVFDLYLSLESIFMHATELLSFALNTQSAGMVSVLDAFV